MMGSSIAISRFDNITVVPIKAHFKLMHMNTFNFKK